MENPKQCPYCAQINPRKDAEGFCIKTGCQEKQREQQKQYQSYIHKSWK